MDKYNDKWDWVNEWAYSPLLFGLGLRRRSGHQQVAAKNEMRKTTTKQEQTATYKFVIIWYESSLSLLKERVRWANIVKYLFCLSVSQRIQEWLPASVGWTHIADN
jgi:hypothetical protein